MSGEYKQDLWGNGGRRVVEEVESEEDSDTQGAGLISTAGKRFSSDPLRFTGIDMGEVVAHPRRRHAYEHSEDEDSQDDSEGDTELDEEGLPQLSSLDNEDELVDSAMRRIRRAQANGKHDVKLSKKELAALENRRRRSQAAESKKKKKKEPRYAVPLSQLTPVSQKENRLPQAPSSMPSGEILERHRGQPPVGWFAPPSASRPVPVEPRRRSSMHADHERREGSTSPFQYSYVQHPGSVPSPRHTSDPASRARSSRGPGPYEDPRLAQSTSSSSIHSIPTSLDPFRYMTSGPYAPYHASSGPQSRDVSGSSYRHSLYEPSTRSDASASRRRSRHFTPDEESSSEDDDSTEEETSDEVGEGAQVRRPNVAAPVANEPEQIVVEVEREPTPERRVTRSKKKSASSNTSSPKRKSVPSSSSRRKKGSK